MCATLRASRALRQANETGKKGKTGIKRKAPSGNSDRRRRRSCRWPLPKRDTQRIHVTAMVCMYVCGGFVRACVLCRVLISRTGTTWRWVSEPKEDRDETASARRGIGGGAGKGGPIGFTSLAEYRPGSWSKLACPHARASERSVQPNCSVRCSAHLPGSCLVAQA